jgi:Leucine-rich repeat (LRR) protein
VKNPHALATFPHEDCTAIRHEEGDMASGTGRIELMNGWIIDFERTPERGWVIANAIDTYVEFFDSLEHALLVPEHVISLVINDPALTQLPPQLGLLIHLKELKILCLERLEELPKEIGNLWNLEKLIIDNGTGCQMNVSIPPSIGQLENLRTLTLYGAIDPRENGSQEPISASKIKDLPATIGQLQNLEELDLGRNGLRTVPSAVASLRNLKRLLLDYNDIHELPAFIGELKNLQELSLLGNGGVNLPLSLNKLHGLTVFMGNNSLTLEAQEQLRRTYPDITFDFENDYDDSAANEN